ncbi:MAG: hypothetical protein H7259_00730, partial [Cytophagales bacterium]|nr:hypothetical protein [Cytophaga sp.]
TLTQSIDGSYDPLYKEYDVMVHGLPFVPKSCEADGVLVTFDVINPDKNVIRFNVSKAFTKIVVKA